LGETATVIAASYAAVCAVALAFMVAVARSTRGRGPDRPADVQRLRELERRWFVIVVVLLVALAAATIFFIPYGQSAAKDAQVVEAEALQFAWVLRGTPVKAGREVEFRLTSRDVNHSFAVYTMAGELLFQVQVMPGRTQTYVHTFEQPGDYRILCLEYCGVDHDAMQADLVVVA
jgi:cytochrome c oxidase subunit 2